MVALPSKPVEPRALPEAQFDYTVPRTNLTTVDGALVAGMSSWQYIQDRATYMTPQEVGMFQDWATAHPTADPRVWVPLAVAGVHPTSPEGMQVAHADVLRQDEANLYGVLKGTPVSSLPSRSTGVVGDYSVPDAMRPTFPGPQVSDIYPRPTPTPEQITQATPGGIAGVELAAGPNVASSMRDYFSAQEQAKVDAKAQELHGTGRVVHDIWHTVTWPDRVGAHALNWALSSTPATTPVYDVGKAYVRQVVTAASAPIQFENAMLRNIGGDTAYQTRIADELKLTPQERGIAFRNSDQLDVEQTSTLPANRGGGGTAIHIGKISDLPTDRQAVVRDANAQWMQTGRRAEGLTGPTGVFRSAARQTDLGQEVIDPRLITQTIDRQTGQWVDEKGFFPNKVGTARSEAEAAKAYNLLTAEQTAKYGGPVPWTWGRGLMGLWEAPDTASYRVWSGVVDGLDNLFFDPLNFVPLGFIGKGADVAAIGGAKVLRKAGADVGPLAAEAYAGKGASSLVSTPVDLLRHAPDEALDPQVWSRVAADQGGLARKVDPALQAQRDAETGVQHTPHGNVLVKDVVWNYLLRGRGAATVSWLAKQTSPATIIRASGGRLDGDIAIRLAQENTEEGIRQVLAHRLGIDIEKGDLGRIGASGPALFKDRSMMDTWGPISEGTLAAQRLLRRPTERTSRYAGNVQYALEQGATRFGAHAAAASTMYAGAFRMAPGTIPLNLDDVDITHQQLDRWMQSARIPFVEYRDHLDKILVARSGAERYDLIYSKENGVLHQVVEKELLKQGIDKAKAREMVTAYESGLRTGHRPYWNDSIAGGHGADPGDLGTPLLETENLSKIAQLPDIRRIRRDTSTLGKAIGSTDLTAKGFDAVADAMYNITSAWRGVTLARQAYSFREILESNIAMSLSGYVSPMTHPFAFLSMVFSGMVADHIAKTSGLVAGALSGAYARRGMIGAAKGVDRVMTSKGMQVLMPGFNVRQAQVNGDAWGESLDRVLAGAHEELPKMFRQLGAGNGNWQLDTQTARMAAKYQVARDMDRDPDRYIHIWANKLQTGHEDRTIRDLTDTTLTRDDVAHRFAESGMLRRMNYSRPDLVSDASSADRHLQGLADTIDKVTIGDARLKEAMHTGMFEDEPIFLNHRHRDPTISPKLQAYLKSKVEDPQASAQLKNVMPVLHEFGNTYSKTRWAHGVINDFFTSVAQWSDLFARGPLIRQAYARRVISLADQMSPDARLQAVANLRRNGDTKLARLILDRTKANPAGILGVDHVEALASGYAMREAQRVFYDAHQRQNWSLALRTLAPFAQATFNTFRRWGEFSMRNPQYMYRTLKPLEGLTDPGSVAIYQAFSALTPGQDPYEAYWTPHDDAFQKDGYFFTDEYGNRKFAYPLVGSLVNLFPHGQGLMAAPEGSLAGLNVAGNTWNPGVGPFVTLAEALVLPGDAMYKHDDTGDLLRMLNPYGLPTGDAFSKAVKSFAPTWLRKINDASDPTQQANRTTKIAMSLMGTGHYDRSNPADLAKVVNDAKHLSGWLRVFDAFVGALTPSTVNTEFLIEAKGDKTGGYSQLLHLATLGNEYRRYITPLPGQDALLARQQGEVQFLSDYGHSAVLSTIPRTDTTGAQATNDLWAWRSQNPGTYDAWKTVVGNFFAGDDPAQKFSINAYHWQQQAGERTTKPTMQVFSDWNDRTGWMLWNARQREFDSMPADDAASAKAAVKEAIRKKFPGWTGEPKNAGKFDQNMDTMRAALADPKIMSLDSAPYIRYYLDTRDAAIAMLRDPNGLYKTSGNLTSKTAINANITQQVLNVAKEMRQRDTSGGFTNFWTQLGSIEFRNTDLEN